MSGIKKLSAPGASQDFASSDKCSGNNKFEEVTPINWPYQGFTIDNEVMPKDNSFPTPQLSNNPHAYSDTGAKGATGNNSNSINKGLN